ncbi:hypothetical protein DFAR_2690019 [Desulfarculales bacterium]
MGSWGLLRSRQRHWLKGLLRQMSLYLEAGKTAQDLPLRLHPYIDDMSRLIVHTEVYRAWPLIYRPCARPYSTGDYHASSTSTTAQPFAHTTWKRSPPPWAVPWSTHRPTCPRAGARSQDFPHRQAPVLPRLQGRYPSGHQ